MKNKYIYRAHISERKTRLLIQCFALDLTATQDAQFASGKTIVFGLYKRGEKVYTEIVPDVKRKTLQDLIRGRADLESVIHTDGWVAYDGLVDLGYKKHYRVQHGNDEFSKGNGQHINGIEGFRGYAKHRLTKFKGIPKEKFLLHLKETEFRFNHRGQNLYHILLKELRDAPLR